MDDVGKFDGILNEEDRDVVANDVPVALLRVELGGETPNITNGVGAATGPSNSGKADEYRGRAGSVVEDGGMSYFGNGCMELEDAVRAKSTSMDHWKTKSAKPRIIVRP